MACSTKRPPLAWDGKKPLKMIWALYAGRLMMRPVDIEAYNVNEGWYQLKGQSFVNYVPFLVKRLD